MNAEVLILMGSDSDLPVMEESANVLKEFGIRFEMHISSAHRSSRRTAELASEAAARGSGGGGRGSGLGVRGSGLNLARFTR